MKKVQSLRDKEYILIRNITLITIFINIVLSLLKFFAGIYSYSTAMLADALHSASDVVTSAGVIIGVYLANKPQDECHPYGHGKAESITGFLLALLLLLVGIQVGFKGIESIFQSNYKQPGNFALIAAIISIFLKELQYQISIKVGRELNSTPLIADAWHHRSDAFSSIGAMLGILGAKMGILFLDPLVAIFISIVIIKIAINLLKQTLKELMDSSLPWENIKDLSRIILETPHVLSVEDIRSRKYSRYVCLNISIGIDPSHPVDYGHKIAHEVEKNIEEYLNYSTQVYIHVEPYNHA